MAFSRLGSGKADVGCQDAEAMECPPQEMLISRPENFFVLIRLCLDGALYQRPKGFPVLPAAWVM